MYLRLDAILKYYLEDLKYMSEKEGKQALFSVWLRNLKTPPSLKSWKMKNWWKCISKKLRKISQFEPLNNNVAKDYVPFTFTRRYLKLKTKDGHWRLCTSSGGSRIADIYLGIRYTINKEQNVRNSRSYQNMCGKIFKTQGLI